MYALILIKYFYLFHDMKKKPAKSQWKKYVLVNIWFIYFTCFYVLDLICQIKINDAIFWVKTVLCRKIFG